MSAQPVEWVLVVFYGKTAHRATYGRLSSDTKYTKDYIQLSRKAKFLDRISEAFPLPPKSDGDVALTYKWPQGSSPGNFVLKSADRPHLKWETSLGAPQAWRMALSPSDSAAETIPGNPNHQEFKSAENEFQLLESRGAGQPYLLAIKLRDEPRTLHVRTYLKDPGVHFSWASIALAPQAIRELAENTSQKSALQSGSFQSGGIAPSKTVLEVIDRLVEAKVLNSVVTSLEPDTARTLADYLRNPGHGIFFDPSQNHDGWIQPSPLPKKLQALGGTLVANLDALFPPIPSDDLAAEALIPDPDEVKFFSQQITNRTFEVSDLTATVKIRGSAQRAFADAVKSNYKYRCAITGIASKSFLVASHIVPWSADQSIRLDPSNGICLSLLVDRAFEHGFLIIQDDLTIKIDLDRIGADKKLRDQLVPYDGLKLTLPGNDVPQKKHLERRRKLLKEKRK